jgi:glycosyltransferase involved in cell wall biosynthesis
VDPIRLGLFAESPIYYQAPLYRRLAEDPRLDFTAIFGSSEGARPTDSGYGQLVSWGVDVLGGYRSIFLRRASSRRAGEAPGVGQAIDLLQKLRSQHFEVLWLHGYNSIAHVVARVFQGLAHRPTLFREEQTLLEPRSLWRAAAKAAGLPLLFRGAHALYIGSNSRAWFKHYGVPDSRLHHAPYCVDNPRFQEFARRHAAERAQLRRAIGVRSDGGPVILTVGRLIEKKQPQFLLEAFARVRRQRPCTLLFVGSGAWEARLRAMVAEQGIPDVIFAGFLDQNDVSRAYASADIFALTSRARETWGVVVNEAMNFALPVVVSDHVGCAADLVREAENGFVVPIDGVDELADRLMRLLESDDLRRRLGAASRAIIDEWKYDRAAAGVLEAVRAAVGPARWQRSGG